MSAPVFGSPASHRRAPLRNSAAFVLCLLAIGFGLGAPAWAATSLTSEQALVALREGQARFIAGQPQHPHQDAARRQEVSGGQHPIATVLTCADSRVSPELLFDQGLGDLFVVRVAGNVAQTAEIGSSEYATEHLGTPLLLVLGHSQCGAVAAVTRGDPVGGNIPAAVASIAPAVESVRAAQASAPFDQFLAAAVQANVWHSIDALFAQSAITRDLVRGGKLQVVGGVYDLVSGEVSWLGQHPEQARLLEYTGGPAAHPSGAAHGTDAAHTAPAADAATGAAHAAPGAQGGASAPVARPQVMRWFVGAGIVALLGLVGIRALRQRMKKWALGRRIGAGFALTVILLGATSAAGYFTIHHALLDFTLYRADARHSREVGELHVAFLELSLAARDRAPGRYQQHLASAQATLTHLRQNIVEVDRQDMLTTVERQLTDHAKVFGELVEATRRHGQTEPALAQQLTAAGEVIDAELTTLQAAIVADQDHVGPIVQRYMTEANAAILASVLAAALLAIAAAVAIARSIVDALRAQATALSENAGQVATAARQVSGASQTFASGASEQAASLEQTSAALAEITAMTQRNSTAAQDAQNLSAQAHGVVDAGAKGMNQLQSAMDGIKASSDNIARIMKTIDEIAFQTNILALNAAVEAARAGEAGAGFAIVAEEVRALAQRSANCAKETAALISDAIVKSSTGVELSRRVGSALHEITDKARAVDTHIQDIARSSSEQASGIAQVDSAVTQMDHVTQANAAGAEESAAAAEELLGQAESLHATVQALNELVLGARAVRKASTTSRSTAAGSPNSAPRAKPAAVRRTSTHAVS